MTASTPPPPPPMGATGTYASWISRVLAYLVDGLIAGIPAMVLAFIATFVGGSSDATDSAVFTGAGVSILVLAAVVSLAISIWNYGFKQGTTGQTVGKGVMDITVVTDDGQYLGVGMSILRTILMSVLGSLCFLNYLWPLFDDRNRAWHDMIVNSLVLDAG